MASHPIWAYYISAIHSIRLVTDQIHHNVRLFLPVCGYIARDPIFIEINMDHLLTLPRWVGEEVIVWCDPHTRLCCCEDRLQVNISTIQSWERRTFGRSPVCGTWCMPRLNHSTLTHQLNINERVILTSLPGPTTRRRRIDRNPQEDVQDRKRSTLMWIVSPHLSSHQLSR
jgi:hypothetical protein